MNVISQSTEYALRALVFLAANREQTLPASEISKHTGVPVHYLGKVLKNLGRSGILRARRGPGGGFTFSCSPDSITVLDVVNAVDPLEHVQRCPLGRDPHGGILCPLHRHLEQAIIGIENAFRAATIGQLAAEMGPISLCRITDEVPTDA